MGRHLVRFASKDDSRQTAAAVRGHADEIALLLGDGDDLLVAVVALDTYRVDGNPVSARDFLDGSESFSASALCCLVCATAITSSVSPKLPYGQRTTVGSGATKQYSNRRTSRRAGGAQLKAACHEASR